MVKAEKEKEKAVKEKKAFESQFAILESEKTSLTKALEEAKATRDGGRPTLLNPSKRGWSEWPKRK